MQLETSRLILRPWEESDAKDLYECAKSPEVWPAAWWPPHTSVENSREIINKILAVPENYAVVDKENNWVIWNIAFTFWKKSKLWLKDTEAELWYWLWVPYWWKWLIPEATNEMLRHAFEDLKLENVWCCYCKWNEKSKRVQEKCWFKYKYTLENVEVKLLNEIRTDIVQCISRGERLDSKK